VSKMTLLRDIGAALPPALLLEFENPSGVWGQTAPSVRGQSPRFCCCGCCCFLAAGIRKGARPRAARALSVRRRAGSGTPFLSACWRRGTAGSSTSLGMTSVGGVTGDQREDQVQRRRTRVSVPHLFLQILRAVVAFLSPYECARELQASLRGAR